MSLDTAMNFAKEKDFMEFEKAIKQELHTRIMQDPYMRKRSQEFEKYKNIADIYKSTSEKPTGE